MSHGSQKENTYKNTQKKIIKLSNITTKFKKQEKNKTKQNKSKKSTSQIENHEQNCNN